MSFGQNKQKNSSSMNSKEELSDKDACDEPDLEQTDNDVVLKKSVEDILSGSHEAIGNSISQALSFTSGTVLQSSPIPLRRSPSPSESPINSPRQSFTKRDHIKYDTHLSVNYQTTNDTAEDSISKSSDSSNLASNNDLSKTSQIDVTDRPKTASKISERAKKKSWYSVLYPSYKSRSEDFKKLFKGVPDDERLVVETMCCMIESITYSYKLQMYAYCEYNMHYTNYSCAVQRDILVHGRLYVSQNYLCFYANIFRWETCLSIKWKDVTALTKEKTARVIPNAILICTTNEKHFITSFASRDKAYLMLFRVWQNALMDKPMQPQEMWQWVHNCYGDELGLTSDDEDYIDPYENRDDDNMPQGVLSKVTDSVSEEHSEPHSDSVASSVADLRIVSANQKHDSKLNHRKILNKSSRNIIPPISEHQVPTDMSDSSDSENGQNIPFICTAECTSMHEGRQLVHTILPINVDTLLSLLFSKSKFLVDFHNNRKTTDMVHCDWELNEDGLKCRTVTLTVALTQAVGPKCSHVTESQLMRECSEPGQLYSIDITSTNAGIPYADSFYVFMHYCLVRTVDDHTMFSVHAQVKYKKSVWGVVKGFIEKNTWAGLEDFYTALLRALQSEYCIPPAKAKGRRPRRGVVSQQRLPEEQNNHKQPQTARPTRSTPLVTKRQHIPRSGWESLQLFVAFLMITLIVLNVILFFKLWTLEGKRGSDENNFPDFTKLKKQPSNNDDWLSILKQQEALHSTETTQWQHILQAAIDLLRKTEITLNELLHLIDLQEVQQQEKNVDNSASPVSSTSEKDL
ncbi:Protein Aster-B [Pseudolycoriella hygida]|uniref:Protein Aster-B n=1 Tax=Pseudolycoriella hygida TaxID=35572 RepID=A0A9Q0NDH6_9DIPT|nr:Protein Aster-B [Pseudolycoriella hygida]